MESGKPAYQQRYQEARIGSGEDGEVLRAWLVLEPGEGEDQTTADTAHDAHAADDGNEVQVDGLRRSKHTKG